MTTGCKTITGTAPACQYVCYKGNKIFNKLCPEAIPNDVPWEYGWVTYYNHPDYGTTKIANPDLQSVKDSMYDAGWGNFTPKYSC